MGQKESIKKRIYEIIEVSSKDDIASHAYDMMIYVAILVGLFPLTIKVDNPYTRMIDYATVGIFLFDYIVRIYTSDYKMGYKSYKSYLAYLVTPMAIIDLLSLAPILTILNPSVVTFGLFRLFRVLRVFKLLRYSKTMRQIENVFRRVKDQLLAVLILALVYILVCAMVIFAVEPDLFETFFDAFYWASISITTIGYGDIVPVTQVGKLVTVVSSLVGVAVIALPSGIITAAYMDEIKKKKSKHEL